MNLSGTVKSIQDIMRKDDGVDGDAQRIGQLTWMLFLKVFDQREEEWEDDKTDYVSPIPEQFRWRNWAAYVADADGKKKPQMQGSELIPFVTQLFEAFNNIDPSVSPTHKVIHDVFTDSYNYMKSGPLMLAVIEKLEEAINFHDFTTRVQLGTVYEQILNDLRGAGNAGEFYTPRAITEFMVDRVAPNLAKRESVLDPACGTGGFLTAAIDYFRKQLTAKSSAEDKRSIEDQIRGMEKKQLPHLLCTTNMLLHGIDVPSQIEHCNTLGRPWNDWSANDKVDCLITNPPFGGYEDDGVGADFPSDLRTRETADMFMALIIKKLLKDDGGRGAVVLPDGTMFGDGIKGKLKELLLRECNLHTVIRLPKGVFAPYTTIKTNLLFFTKGKPTETIWFYEHPYPEGYKNYSKTKPIRIEEFKAEQDWWSSEANDFADRVESELAWKIDFKTKKEDAEAAAKPYWDKAEELNNAASRLESRAKELKASIVGVTDADKRKQAEDEISRLREEAEPLRLQARDAQSAGDRLYWPIYNLDIKNPNSPEDEIHDLDLLLEKYKLLLGQVEDTQNQLKGELAAALAHHFDECATVLIEFGHIASAPEGVQRLREMIYNLAITGDLTKQLPEDGNAKSLLEEIERERQRRIKAKEFKRMAKLESEPLDIPANIKLPESWKWTRLLDIGEISPRNEAKDDALAAFIPMSGIPQLHKGKLFSELRNWGDVKKGFTHFANNDVVVAKITPCFENGKAAVISGLDNGNGIGAGTTELHVFRPIHPEIHPVYIYLFLRSPFFAVKGEQSMTGTAGQKRLPTEYFATRALPLPPFEEQKRIVVKVDELMALCDKLEEQQKCSAALAKKLAVAATAAITGFRTGRRNETSD